MAATGAVSFGDLLRRYRLAAALTQEELAERAQLSVRAISDLERGARSRPRRDTVRLLAAALDLAPAEWARLEAAARRAKEGSPAPGEPAPAPEGAARRSNLPIQATSFVGRERELAEVDRLLRATRVLTLTGTGGVGKTRLALQTATVDRSGCEGCFLTTTTAFLTGLKAPGSRRGPWPGLTAAGRIRWPTVPRPP